MNENLRGDTSKMKKIFAFIMSAVLLLLSAACSGNPQPSDQGNTDTSHTNVSMQEENSQSSNSSSGQEDIYGKSTSTSAMNGTQITLSIGDVRIPAVLNDTVAAQEFVKMLPLTVNAGKGQYDYCGTGSSLKYDEEEMQAGWKNGDIGYARGWFALFHSGEEQSQSYTSEMIIGHIDEGYLDTVRNLPDSIEIIVELADEP